MTSVYPIMSIKKDGYIMSAFENVDGKGAYKDPHPIHRVLSALRRSLFSFPVFSTHV